MTRRRADMYTLAAAFFTLFVVEGGVWGALYFFATTMETTALALYPSGVYDATVLALVDFGLYAMPLIILASVAAMVAIGIQRQKRGEL